MPQSQPPIQTVSRRQIRFVEILGLFLATISLITLVELYPRPSVSSSPPFNLENLLSSRFTVTNDGYLDLNDVHAVCFVWKAQATLQIRNTVLQSVSPERGTLQPTQGLTVPCTGGFMLVNGQFSSADLAIVVSYRPWPFTFIRKRKFFRFVARFANGNIVWDKQP